MPEVKKVAEVRKLQITGGSTYTVSLPKNWVEKMGLSKGSLLSIEEQNDGALVISSEEIRKPEEKIIALIDVSPEEKAEAVIRKVISSYLVGYNIIEVKPKDDRLSSKQRNAIKEFSRRMLVGTEIVTDSPEKLTLQVLLGYPELSVKSVVRRMCAITVSMHEGAVTALKELNQELARDVIFMDDEVDRFSLYVIRQLKAAVQNERIIKDIGLSSPRDCLGYRLIIKSVERTADHAAKIAEKVLLLKTAPPKEVLDGIVKMSDSAISVFEDAIDALFRQNFEKADLVVQRSGEVALTEEALRSFVNIKDVETASTLRLIVESVKRTAEYASDIAEIVLNLTIDKVISPIVTK